MRLWILSILLILLATSLQAAPMSEQRVAAAAETWLQQVITENRPDARVARMEPQVVNDQTVGYIAHLFGGGFCVCGADDILLPVILYVPRGEFDPANPNLQVILTHMSGLLDLGKQGDTRLDAYRSILNDRAQDWQDLSAGQAPQRILAKKGRDPDVMMKVPLTSTWGQRTPYNDQCPGLPATEPSLVGCVATSMTQIMNYWKWPLTGTGNRNREWYYHWSDEWLYEPLAVDPGIPNDDIWAERFRWTPDGGGQLMMKGYWDASMNGRSFTFSDDEDYLAAQAALYNRMTYEIQNEHVNFALQTYDWSLMADQHSDPVDEGDEEVAKLCYQAGVSVNMFWGYFNSNSGNHMSAIALEDYFRYDPDTLYGSPDPEALIEEIRYLRPVQFGGTGTVGGHSWLILGYDLADVANPMFYMNMGWSGSEDSWYTLDAITHDLVSNQDQVTQIAPLNVVRFIGPEGSGAGDGSPDNPFNYISDAMSGLPDGGTLIFKAGSQYSWTASGILAQPLVIKGHDVTFTSR